MPPRPRAAVDGDGVATPRLPCAPRRHCRARAEIADFNQPSILRSNIIGQSVDLGREEVRNRIAQLTDYFMARGMTDPTGARH